MAYSIFKGFGSYLSQVDFGGGTFEPSTTMIDGPDDRYLPGYSAIDSEGNRTFVAPRLRDLNVKFSLYGIPIPISHGVRRLNGNIIWALPIEEKIIKFNGRQGDGPMGEHTLYHYYGSWAVSFGYAPAATEKRDIIRIWADGNLIMDRRAETTITTAMSKVKFYDGSQTEPDPTIEKDMGEGGTPAYKDQMYVVFEDVNLEPFGNRFPAISVEIGDITEIESSVELAEAPGGARVGGPIAVDWDLGLVWAEDAYNEQIHEYDVNNFTHLRTMSAGGIMGSTFSYIPWMHMFITNDRNPRGVYGGIAANYVTISVRDAATGAKIASFNPNISGREIWDYFGYSSFVMPVLVYGPEGPQTYILAWSHFNDFLLLRLYAPDEPGNPALGDNWSLIPKQIVKYAGKLTFYTASNTKVTGEGYTDLFMVFLERGSIKRIRVYADDFFSVGTFYNSHGADMFVLLHYYGPEDVLITMRTQVSTQLEFWNKWSMDGLATHVTEGFQGTVASKNWYMSNTDNGTLVAEVPGAANQAVTVLDIKSMEITEFATPGSAGLGPIIADSRTGSIIGLQHGTDHLARIFYDKVSVGRVTLASFLEMLAGEAGYSVPSELEVSENIDDMIDGGLLLERTNFRSLLDALSTVYRFDIIESDGKIQLVRKPFSFEDMDFEVPSTEMAIISENDEQNVTLVSRREDEIALPKSVELNFMSREVDYQWTVTIAQRSSFPIATSDTNEVLTARVPIIMQAAEAKQLAYRMLYQGAWMTRTSFNFRLPWKYLFVEPSDVGTVENGAYTYQVQLKEVMYNADYSLSCKATAYLIDDPWIDLEADAGTISYQNQYGIVRAGMVPIDSKLLVPGTDAAHPSGVNATMYYVIHPIGPTELWSGATGEVKVSGSGTWNEIGMNTVIPVIGHLEKDIPTPVSPYMTQADGSFRVKLVTSNTSLESVTDADILEDKNRALVGNRSNGWEVIQFRDVTENEDGTFTLSHLVRGRRGTDVFLDKASGSRPGKKGDTFILLEDEWMEKSGLPLEAKDTSVLYAAIPRDHDSHTWQAFVFKAESAKPLRPVHVEAEWDSPDLDVYFIRQTRGECSWQDLKEDVSFVEANHNFRLTLYADDTFDDTGSETIDADEDNEEVAGRYKITVPSATLNTVYGSTTPSTVYLGVKQFSDYYDGYGDETQITINV